MLVLLGIFILVALIFGIGGAITLSLWFLLLFLVAVIVAAIAGRSLLGRSD
jgi:hypothetical protein